MNIDLSLSIVSHGHAKHVNNLLLDLSRLKRFDFEVVLTLNFPEEYTIDFKALPYNVIILNNDHPKGFAENHNFAFSVCNGKNFVILNPDIRLINDPFEVINKLIDGKHDAIYAPSITNSSGELEDSARHFPTPMLLVKKVFSKIFRFSLAYDDIPSQEDVLMPDWVAGMFVVVPRDLYKNLHGLSERYHMYYEDVDFCARARLEGYSIFVAKNAKVLHDAQRDSHRKLRYMMWHLQSAMKFFTSKAYLKIRLQRMGRI